MFEPSSRYYALEDARYEAGDGREIAYKRRRFLPPGETLLTFAEVVVTEGDRLDLIAARTLGDPEQFWRIADKANTLNPFDLTTPPGRRLHIPVPR